MITYGKRTTVDTSQVISLFESAGILSAITSQPSRIEEMILNANLIYTAYDGDLLVGIARCITDFSFCCYLSELAVRKEYQNKRIGQTLIKKVQETIGDEVSLILLSSKLAMSYYPKAGLTKVENAFSVKRKY